jgi:glutathione S-transferase
MTNLTLFHFPGACSRVTMFALEHVGAEFADVLVNLMAGEHMAPEYQTTNPRGKVPALLIDGTLLSENAAILIWIDSIWPEANLLPHPEDALGRAQIYSDLFWLSSVWHPYVRANKMPVRWTTGDVGPVRERGVELLTPCMIQLEARLSQGPWYYGETWSILDVYFYWAYTTAQDGQFSLEPYTHIAAHRAAVEAMPIFKRVREREELARMRVNQPRYPR